eukprot:CAMPEP_0206013304 /NCGR_PEP_ID=MMETSP1464-20131121/16248_1 /ASSEMBLY_ACC=CAM_ASM_001124 /TAXON_ID=119497 /ORGANISM="Exanthemachrysis gayraliae, Strain RCC1523" /LENGTH=171 /DNA_ID=CAMNT_0053387019 /DNA_START=205 /DNA_END=720 /DNA_ORIENTATION=-
MHRPQDNRKAVGRPDDGGGARRDLGPVRADEVLRDEVRVQARRGADALGPLQGRGVRLLVHARARAQAGHARQARHEPIVLILVAPRGGVGAAHHLGAKGRLVPGDGVPHEADVHVPGGRGLPQARHAPVEHPMAAGQLRVGGARLAEICAGDGLVEGCHEGGGAALVAEA